MVNLDLQDVQRRTDDWTAVLDSLLVGITHNISNRVATLAGVSDILSGDPTIPPILRALADEVPRLEESIRLLRLLAVPPDECEEALEATRLTDDAISLARLHPSCHMVIFDVPASRDVPPVVARPTALTHAIVVGLIMAGIEASNAHDALNEEGAGVERPIQVRVSFAPVGDDLVITAGTAVVRARLLSARRPQD